MIILLGRSLERVQPVIDSIKETDSNVKVKFVEVDLASLSSVRKAAQSIVADQEIPHINVVINNAAVMACPYQKTEDGFELQLAANYLGHFVLTNTIMPKVLAAGPGARLVFVSSSGHRYNPFRFFDPNFEVPGSYGEFSAYGSSKAAVILYAALLKKRLAPRGIHVYALDPGSISTNLQAHVKDLGPTVFTVMDEGCWRIMGMSLAKFRETNPSKTLQQGCATTLRAALDPDLPKEDGLYLQHTNLTTDTRLIKEWATDPELASKCWELSEELVGEKFDL
jgi:NAD(P)-dependent dehydrogenase (short-subunit alcohol dehydrogenase family)